ncbi:MAG: hypothetical protein ACOX3K_04880 [Bacilli bacterium]
MMKRKHLSLMLISMTLLYGCQNQKPKPLSYAEGVAKLQEAKQAEEKIVRCQETLATNANLDGFIGTGFVGTPIDYAQVASLEYEYTESKKHYQENDTCYLKVGNEIIADYQDETLVYYEDNNTGYIDYTLAPHAKPEFSSNNKVQATLDVIKRRNVFLATVSLSDFASFYVEIEEELPHLNEVGAVSFFTHKHETVMKIIFDNDKFAAYQALVGDDFALDLDLGLEFDLSGMSLELTRYNITTSELTLIIDAKHRGCLLMSKVEARFEVKYTSEPGANPFMPDGIDLDGTIEVDIEGTYTRTGFDQNFVIALPDDLDAYVS